MKKKPLTDELKEELLKIFEKTSFKFESIHWVNHNPHPFMIGPKHVIEASKNHMGMLGKEVFRKIPCASPCCNVPYDEHTYDTICFVSLKKDITNEEAQKDLKKINVFMMEHDLIEGYVFVDTKEKFRIT